MRKETLVNRSSYFIACVREFAGAYDLTEVAAFDYLKRYRGMAFLSKCYEAEHTVSYEDAVKDLSVVCRRHGGKL